MPDQAAPEALRSNRRLHPQAVLRPGCPRKAEPERTQPLPKQEHASPQGHTRLLFTCRHFERNRDDQWVVPSLKSSKMMFLLANSTVGPPPQEHAHVLVWGEGLILIRWCHCLYICGHAAAIVPASTCPARAARGGNVGPHGSEGGSLKGEWSKSSMQKAEVSDPVTRQNANNKRCPVPLTPGAPAPLAPPAPPQHPCLQFLKAPRSSSTETVATRNATEPLTQKPKP